MSTSPYVGQTVEVQMSDGVQVELFLKRFDHPDELGIFEVSLHLLGAGDYAA